MWYIAIPVIVAAILAVVIYFLWKKEMKVSYSDLEGPFTEEQVKSWFPLQAFVSQEILDSSNYWDIYNCVGVNTLKSVLPTMPKLTWARKGGTISIEEDNWIPVYISSNDVDMMEITKPQWVTFSVADRLL